MHYNLLFIVSSSAESSTKRGRGSLHKTETETPRSSRITNKIDSQASDRSVASSVDSDASGISSSRKRHSSGASEGSEPKSLRGLNITSDSEKNGL